MENDEINNCFGSLFLNCEKLQENQETTAEITPPKNDQLNKPFNLSLIEIPSMDQGLRERFGDVIETFLETEIIIHITVERDNDWCLEPLALTDISLKSHLFSGLQQQIEDWKRKGHPPCKPSPVQNQAPTSPTTASQVVSPISQPSPSKDQQGKSARKRQRERQREEIKRMKASLRLFPSNGDDLPFL